MSRIVQGIGSALGFGPSRSERRAAAEAAQAQRTALEAQQRQTQRDVNRRNELEASAEQSRLRSARAGRLKQLAFAGTGEQGLAGTMGS
jgi:hypothetical protein